jgi:hypothetical protein
MKRKPSETLSEFVDRVYELEKDLHFSNENMFKLEEKYNLTYLAYSELVSRFRKKIHIEETPDLSITKRTKMSFFEEQKEQSL